MKFDPVSCIHGSSGWKLAHINAATAFPVVIFIPSPKKLFSMSIMTQGNKQRLRMQHPGASFLYDNHFTFLHLLSAVYSTWFYVASVALSPSVAQAKCQKGRNDGIKSSVWISKATLASTVCVSIWIIHCLGYYNTVFVGHGFQRQTFSTHQLF